MKGKPSCKWNHSDCFGQRFSPGDCSVLSDCGFNGRTDCPFYKTTKDFYDGIKKYGGLKEDKK